MRIAVIGVGTMGEPIAQNLYQAGMEVTVYCRTAATRKRLAHSGLVAAQSSAQAIACNEWVLLLVPSGDEVDAVLGRDTTGHGSIAMPLLGKTIVLMATVAPAYSLGLHNAVTAAGGRYIEAPLSGSRQPAQAGQLLVLAAAQQTHWIDAAMPVFDAIGKKTLRCCTVPTAMAMKLANQLLLIAGFEALAEAAHFAQACGLDQEVFWDMALAGPLANAVLRMKAPKLLAEDFSAQAAIRHVHKDIGLVCAQAEQCGAWLPAAQAHRALFTEAMEQGMGAQDAVAIIRLLRSKAVP